MTVAIYCLYFHITIVVCNWQEIMTQISSRKEESLDYNCFLKFSIGFLLIIYNFFLNNIKILILFHFLFLYCINDLCKTISISTFSYSCSGK